MSVHKSETAETVLEVTDLKKYFPVTGGVLNRHVSDVKAVDEVNFAIESGETLGLVGESGCGKSTLGKTVLRLHDPTDGRIEFLGDDITTTSRSELRDVRRNIQIVFQDPASSLNPRMTVAELIQEPMRSLTDWSTDKRESRTLELIEEVGLNESHLRRSPHEFSGGQQQRIAIARALSVNPRLVVADEPTSALDVSVQAKILNLFDDLQDTYDLTYLFINHDLSVIKHICDRVAVMYLGELVEVAPTDRLFDDPKHPYTQSLLSAVPRASAQSSDDRIVLEGDVPSPESPPSGCRFHTRCPAVIQPDGYDFKQEHWRSVMDLRLALADGGIDLEALEDIVGVERGEDVASVSDDDLASALRTEYGIPDSLSDPSAEDVLDEALGSIVNEEFDAADELLTTEFATVCEQDHPELRETDASHPAACHLHD